VLQRDDLGLDERVEAIERGLNVSGNVEVHPRTLRGRARPPRDRQFPTGGHPNHGAPSHEDGPSGKLIITLAVVGWIYFGAKVALNASRRSNRRQMREYAARQNRRRQKEWEHFLDSIADKTPLAHEAVRSTPPGRYWLKRLDREFNRIEAGGLVSTAIGFVVPFIVIFQNESWVDYFTAQPVTYERLIWSAVILFGSALTCFGAWATYAHRAVIRRINKSLRASNIDVDVLMQEIHRDYTASPESRRRDYTTEKTKRD